MNKKLFLAGVALLAAVGFTSCNSDTPIDSSNPSGVTPTTARHQVGGDYDWTVIAKDVKEFDDFWTEDMKQVQALVKDKKTASICIVADYFTLEGKTIDIPQLWADAKGKIVNVAVIGNFKNPDYLRADAIKNLADPTKQTKFPVIIDTKNVAGSEVQFTFDGDAFDLELTTDKARSIINGAYEIGYFKAIAAWDNSATEVQSGLVDAIDYASTGDIKEKEDAFIAGLWVRNFVNPINVVKEKGIPVGENKYIYAKDVYVEESCTITNLAYDSDAKKTFKLGTIKVVNPANTVVNFAKDKIYADKIVGVKAEKNIVNCIEAPATSIDLNYIDNIENVTINQATTLKKDVFSGVIFFGNVTFSTEDITSFDDVTFENGLNVKIHADDVTVNFDKVNFNAKPVLSSTLKYTHTAAWTSYKYYQWIVSETLPDKGYYEEYGGNTGKSLMEYNKEKESKEYSDAKLGVDGAGKLTGDKKDEAKNYSLLVISTEHDPGTYTITPEGTLVIMTSACKFNGKTDDDNLNKIWGNVDFKDEGAWYLVQYGDTLYTWRKKDGVTTYVLTK